MSPHPTPAEASPVRVVFMGTPDFAVPTLRRLLLEQQVVGVFTQPDRPAGRGRRLSVSPVKALAESHAVPVFQPASLRKDLAAVAELERLRPEVIVVAAYGLLLPPTVLRAAPRGALNVHASLLPRWRGAAPVAHAILAGDTATGVTIMRIDEGLDTGPMLVKRSGPILADDTTGSLTARLAAWGADLMAAVLPHWVAGRITPEVQDEALATLAPRLTAAEGQLDWTQPAEALARRVRAMHPWPGAFTWLGEARLKIHAATAIPTGGDHSLPPGMVMAGTDGPAVVTGAGWLRLDQVQAPGGRAMAGTEFARGRRDFVGRVLASLQAEPA